MRQREAFTLAVRVVGLLCLIAGLIYLLSGLFRLAGENPSYASSALVYFISGLFWLAVGRYFLRGAPALVRFAFRDDDDA